MVLVIAIFSLTFCSHQTQSLRDQSEPPSSSRNQITLVMPVEGVRPEQLVDSWHDPRGDGTRAHEALDIPAPGGTRVVAAFAGTVVKLFTSKAGGLTAYVRAGDTQAYYAHLSGYVDGLHEGQQVTAGQHIAYVGDTGNAGTGNTHLHFAVHHMSPGDGWWQGVPTNPYPLLAKTNK